MVTTTRDDREIAGSSIMAVAKHLGVSGDVINEIHKRHRQRRFKHIRLKHVRQIAIDEIGVGKGCCCLTVVFDPQTGAVVFIAEGKGVDALDPFWNRLDASGAGIEVDMALAYLAALAGNLPGAVRVLDRFHVIKLYDERLSALRRDIARIAEMVEQKQVIKGTRRLRVKECRESR